MAKTLLYFIVIIFLPGCSFIAKTVYGTRKPKVETQQSIISWLRDHDLPTEDVVTLDTNEYFEFLPLFTTSPLLFESNGKFRAVGYSNGKYCSHNVGKYLSHVNPNLNALNSLDSFIIRDFFDWTKQVSHPAKMSRKKLNELKKTAVIGRDTIRVNFFELSDIFYSLNGLKQTEINATSYDFILVLPFAKFFGHNFQVKDLRSYYQAAINNPNARFKIIFLNLDKQQWWGKEANDKINISI